VFSSRLHDLFPGVGPNALTPDPQTNQCRKPGAGWPDRPSESVRTDAREPRSCRHYECDQPWCGDWTGLCEEHADQYLSLYADFCQGDCE